MSMSEFLTTGTIYPFGDPVTVSTGTELLPFTSPYSVILDVLEIVLENQDPTNKAVLTVDVSEGGTPNLDSQQKAIVAAQSEGAVRWVGLIPTMIRVTASGDPDAGFAPVLVRFKVRGRRTVT